jgi:hemoglobin
MSKIFIFIIALVQFGHANAASGDTHSLYEALGGKQNIAVIVDNFIDEISFDKQVLPFFRESDIDRFREKMNEHICLVADGPCTYTGDSMVDVHASMGVKESDFNRVVDLMVNAMDRADVPHRVQNRLLKKLAALRGEIIYR